MEISEIRIKLTDGKDEKLRAFCSVTIGREFVIRDLKIIEGAKGLFLAMPSRKLSDRCPRCGNKNHLRANFCNECGAKLRHDRAPRDERGRPRLHTDIAHPINSGCRDFLQRSVLEAYLVEREKAARGEYVPPSFDDLDYDLEADLEADEGRAAEGGDAW